MIRIQNLNIRFDEESSLESVVAKRLNTSIDNISSVKILRKAIDARRYKGNPIQFVYMLEVACHKGEREILGRLKKDKNITQVMPKKKVSEIVGIDPDKNPVVVGFGPAGIFAALFLARQGYSPLVFERGLDVDQRHRDISSFWQGGELLENSNVQFGEGGAGTFSDGKLTTRVNDELMDVVLDEFVKAGAPEEIKYLHKPHIGTDLLRNVVKNIRQEIIRLGGRIKFASQVTRIEYDENNQVTGVIVNDSDGYATRSVFLAIGHSARDTYKMLYESKVAMEPKPFAIGLRIEHPQEFIDRAQYGRDAGHRLLPVADYALTYNSKETGRGVYSFCMCPGGQVVAAASEKYGVVTNGMSHHKRDSGVANSAILVTVNTKDFADDVLGGIEFQRKWEKRAFALGGSSYYAPVQSVGDFLSGKKGSEAFAIKPSYQPGTKAVDLHECLPGFVTSMLEEALPFFDKRIPGFANADIPMTGVETRSSAPCRICRSRETYESQSHSGLYPLGEGAGYAGGIMSAAIDGIKGVLAFFAQNSHNNKID